MKEYLGMHDAVFNTEYTILIKKKIIQYWYEFAISIGISK